MNGVYGGFKGVGLGVMSDKIGVFFEGCVVK